jgi:hypothetical protein
LTINNLPLGQSLQEVLFLESAYFPFLQVVHDSIEVEVFWLLCVPLGQDLQLGDAMVLA